MGGYEGSRVYFTCRRVVAVNWNWSPLIRFVFERRSFPDVQETRRVMFRHRLEQAVVGVRGFQHPVLDAPLLVSSVPPPPPPRRPR